MCVQYETFKLHSEIIYKYTNILPTKSKSTANGPNRQVPGQIKLVPWSHEMLSNVFWNVPRNYLHLQDLDSQREISTST